MPRELWTSKCSLGKSHQVVVKTQGTFGSPPPRVEAVHAIPLLSVLYFQWAGLSLPLPVQVLMWLLALFCSVPMLAYLEAMKIGMTTYTPELTSLVTQSKKQWLIPGKSLSMLFGLLPYGPLMAVFSLGHGLLYVLVVWAAYVSGQWLVLGIQVVYLSYLGWTFVFVQAHLRKAGIPPGASPQSPSDSRGKI